MLNKVLLIGHLGQAPELKRTRGGERYAILSLATSERWKDKTSGEKKERTDWHRVVVYAEPLVDVCEKWLTKGAKVWVEGRLSTRKWLDETIGRELYVTEIVLQGFNAKLIQLDKREGGGRVPDPDGAEDYGHSRDYEPAYA